MFGRQQHAYARASLSQLLLIQSSEIFSTILVIL